MNFHEEQTSNSREPDESDELGELLKELGESPGLELGEKDLKKYKKKLSAELLTKHSKATSDKIKNIKSTTKAIEKELLEEGSIIDKIIDFFSGKRLQAIFIYPNKDIKLRKKKLEGKFINFKKQKYGIKVNAIYRYKGKPTSFYFDNNPDPIEFDFEKNEPLVHASSLYNAWQSKIVADLLSGGGVSTKTVMWSISAIIGVGIAAVMIIGALKEPISSAPIIIPFMNMKVMELWKKKHYL